jgi:hypothetical protein
MCLIHWRTACNGSAVHRACCSSWCDVAGSIRKRSGKALDQMWCWSDPDCLTQNQQSKAWMNLVLPKTLWPSGLRRWLKAPFRKGVGSDSTGVMLFGLTLRHDVLHTWSGPYIQRAPATLGPCRCFTNCRLARTTPGIQVSASARGQSGCAVAKGSIGCISLPGPAAGLEFDC